MFLSSICRNTKYIFSSLFPNVSRKSPQNVGQMHCKQCKFHLKKMPKKGNTLINSRKKKVNYYFYLKIPLLPWLTSYTNVYHYYPISLLSTLQIKKQTSPPPPNSFPPTLPCKMWLASAKVWLMCAACLLSNFFEDYSSFLFEVHERKKLHQMQQFSNLLFPHRS